MSAMNVAIWPESVKAMVHGQSDRNTQDARYKASVLLTLLQKYAPENSNAASLLKVLSPLLQQAIASELNSNLEWKDIPGGRTFEETDARTLPGLESAYAKFTIAITGGESDALKAFRERRGH